MTYLNKTKLFICITVLFLAANVSKAQLNPLSGIYFQNQYLANPAMAGKEKGLILNMGFKKQWSSMVGTPQTQAFTAEYGSDKKVAFGINIQTEEAGLIKRSRVMGTYSYLLPLDDGNRKLRLGLSMGVMNERLMTEQIDGEVNDVTVSRFNERPAYLDGDFGVAYTSDKLTIQGAIPNLKGFLGKDDINGAVDRALFFTAVSYKFYFPEAFDGLGFEPRLGYRSVHGFNNIIDAGGDISVSNGAAHLTAIYHSSESATFGLGASIKSLGVITANYTTATGALSGYTYGNFELGIRLHFLKSKESL
ncbi:MAG TPA: PorP/SprF family type IX secretion system membrane protein [Pedobacter sp.]|jgi:type IX secretion system PorP/SprF family membrane protein